MKTINFKKIILVVIVIICLWYIVLEKYHYTQPKTSIDLVRKLQNIEIKDYDKYSINLTKENYKDIKELVSRFNLTVSQFTIIESGNDILILEITPQTVGNKIKIKNVKKMTKEDFEKFF